MSKDSDYTFGEMTVTCDAPGCDAEEKVDGFDNHPPSYQQANQELRSLGWACKKVGTDWQDLCPEHNEPVLQP